MLTGKFILIGSCALKAQHPSFCRHAVIADIDLITTKNNFIANVDFFDKWELVDGSKIFAFKSNARFEIRLEDQCPLYTEAGNLFELEGVMFENLVVASTNCLFSLKKSHITQPIHWKKSIYDYHFLKKRISNWDSDPMAKAILEWESLKVKDRIRVKLNLSKKEFFEQHQVPRLFDHDYLHEQVKRGVSPLYKNILQDGAEVKCDPAKWGKLTFEHKLLCVREEAEVIAIERVLLPNLSLNGMQIASAQEAYDWALFRLATTMTSGWFRDFVIDHYFDLNILESDLDTITLKLRKQLN